MFEEEEVDDKIELIQERIRSMFFHYAFQPDNTQYIIKTLYVPGVSADGCCCCCCCCVASRKRADTDVDRFKDERNVAISFTGAAGAGVCNDDDEKEEEEEDDEEDDKI